MGVWQEQAVQIIEDGAGMTAAEADEVCRTFARPNNEHLIACYDQPMGFYSMETLK